MTAPSMPSARFADWVAEQQRQAPTRRKGERTRDRIRLATVELLNDVGYRDMKVADVCARADVTPPVLYLYFANKQALTADVLREFLEGFLAWEDAGEPRSAYAAILQANRRWIALARENAGLMRCLLQLSEEVPEFAQLYAQASDRWYRRVAQGVIRRFPSAAADEASLRLAAYALGGMIDEVTRKVFTGHDDAVRTLVAQVAPTDDALAHFLSVLWYRALYGEEPPPGDGAPAVARRLRTAVRRKRARDA